MTPIRKNSHPAPEFELIKCRQAWRTRVPEELYPTSWITERTSAALRDCAKGDKPFFIQCSYPDPHHPFTPPGKYWNMYPPEDVPLPPSFRAAHHDLPPHVQWLHRRRDSGTAVKHTQALFACSEREAREASALNYGSISLIDDGVGRLLAELERLGQADNTIVIFASDHGDFLGDHQLLLKGPIHYAGLVRTPFIWKDPWKDPAVPTPRASTALVQAVDLAPTVLARAGVAPFNGIQGKSLLPLIGGGEDTLRDELLIEEEGQRTVSRLPRPRAHAQPRDRAASPQRLRRRLVGRAVRSRRGPARDRQSLGRRRRHDAARRTYGTARADDARLLGDQPVPERARVSASADVRAIPALVLAAPEAVVSTGHEHSGSRFYAEIVESLGSDDGREVACALDALRGQGKLSRDRDGRYQLVAAPPGSTGIIGELYHDPNEGT